VCTPPIVVIRESGLTIIILELELEWLWFNSGFEVHSEDASVHSPLEFQ